MNMIIRILMTAVTVLFSLTAYARSFVIDKGRNLTVSYPKSSRPVLRTAVDMLSSDLSKVFGNSIELTGSNAALKIIINPYKVKDEQGFRMAVSNAGELVITGHDCHGAAYGIIELSRLIGVSPWEWWADATPQRKERFELPEDFSIEHSPSVRYRGIFINDEDWGLMPWSSKTFEPMDIPGRIGPKTNTKIFELMLRLRANTYWPAMHECTVPFFLTEGNREVAERYGIYIGGSHCEPMACNAAGEWSRRGNGDYDYVHNSCEVYRFWEDRVKDVSNQEILYTIGMRGIHDGAMNGAKTVEEQKTVLERVFKDQRRLLARHVNQDVTKVPQVFIPYKEVLDVYNAGLTVPDDVCLMWCDDNYGYIRHFPTAEERRRQGGNGVYYHVSYWGRPHDYLWLGTFSPALLYQQMTTAYDQGIQKIWILNVGDIKPAEYQIELFMDMAWDMKSVRQIGCTQHLRQFLEREFGKKTGELLLPVMQEHYRLAHIRKPEFMGGTRTEENDRRYWNTIRDLPWSEAYIYRRLSDYQAIEDKVENLAKDIMDEKQDEYFQLVKYPVQGAAEMNKKLLYAQLARHGRCNWTKSDAAYDSIHVLTHIYNTGYHNRGKWYRMMDCHPRHLPVFEPVEHTVQNTPMTKERPYLALWNGTDGTNGDYMPCEGLGYEGKAVKLTKGASVSFVWTDKPAVDSVEIELRLLPTHPIEGDAIRIQVSFDGQLSPVTSYETHGRSEEWKENVLTNQAVRTFRFAVRRKKTRHRIDVKALDAGVVLDQVFVRILAEY